MKLQFLIPQYHERNEIIKPLLDSIAIQQNVNMEDIGAIICNDGSDVFLSEDFLNSYPFKIEYYKCEHRGVSATRNACLDHATAEYVMFCDADDMFYNTCGLWIIFEQIDNQPFDSMASIFVEETRDPETHTKIAYINRMEDSTFVHGKVHRRQYLIDENIRWNPNLTIHEDSYFNILCLNLSDRVLFCQAPFYLWRWRDDSVCRHDEKYMLKTYNNMLDSNDALMEEFIRRGKSDKVSFFVANMIMDAYYTMNKDEWINQENQDFRYKTEIRFKEYFLKYKKIWDSVPIEDKMIISDGVRARSVMEGMKMESITINDWLLHIENLN